MVATGDKSDANSWHNANHSQFRQDSVSVIGVGQWSACCGDDWCMRKRAEKLEGVGGTM